MSINHYKRLIRFLNYILGFLTVLPVFLLALGYFADLSYAWTLLLPAAMVLFSFFLQEYCHHLLLFICGNLLCLTAALPPAVLAGLPTGVQTDSPYLLLFFVYLLFSLTLIILNFVWKLQKRDAFRMKNIPLPCLIVPALTQLLAAFLNQHALLPWILTVAVCLILLRFWNEYLLGYVSFLEEAKTVSGVPFGQIVSSNSLLLSVFFVLACLLMTAVCFLPLESLLPAAGGALLAAIRFLVRLIGRLFPQNNDVSEPVPEELPPSTPPGGLGMEAAEASPFWLFLENLLQYVLIFAIIGGALFLLLFAVYTIVKRFYSKRTLENDRVEFLNPFDKQEKLSPLTQPGQSFFKRLFDSSPEQRIRKFWYRTVQNRMPEVTACLSPAEIADELVRTADEIPVVKKLSDFYEKARYSNQPCTKEEAAAAKQLAGKLK